MLRVLKHEDDFVRPLRFSVWLPWRTSCSIRWARIASDRHGWFRVWGWRADLRRRSREEESPKHATKNLLTAVLESWLLSFLYCRFLVRSMINLSSFSRWCRNYSGRGDWRTLDGASHSCYQEPCTVGWGPQQDVPAAVHSRGRSRELIEQRFDNGNKCVQLRNLLVLFLVDSKCLPHLCLLDQFVTDPAATVNRDTGHQMVSLCRSTCEEVKAQMLSLLNNS